MVEYVDTQTGRVLKAVETLSRQFQNHESWHRKELERQIVNIQASRWRVRGLKIAVVTCILSSASSIALVLGHVRFH